MTSNRFAELEAAFEAARQMTGDARARFLSKLEESDTDFARDLLALLNADALDDDPADHIVAASMGKVLGDAEHDLIGKQIGVWKLANGRIPV